MEDPVPGATLAPLDHVEPRQLSALTPSEMLPTDGEIRTMYRIAEALALSGAYKDLDAEKAFAKMVVGRDLGLTPAQAMSGIHLVEGGVSMHYSTLGQFVRSRPGYNYRSGWLKVESGIAADADPYDHLVIVWHDEEDPTDGREIVGAAIRFTVGDEQRGVSRFTIADADKAGLIKRDKAKAAWNTSTRNMLLARAMSNGVKWFVPEVLGGMPVYAPGEVEQARERPSLTAGTAQDAAADEAGSGVDLGPEVDAIIERATALGHRGLTNRAALEIALGDRAPSLVKDWIRRAKATLDEFEAAKRAEQEPPADDAPAEPEQAVSGTVENPPEEEAQADPPPPDAEPVEAPEAAVQQPQADDPAPAPSTEDAIAATIGEDGSGLKVDDDSIQFRDKPDTNERVYRHRACDVGPEGARWVVPLDDSPPPTGTVECAACAAVLPVVAA